MIMGSLFLTREIELAATKNDSITLFDDEVRWHLPVSKTDPRALGVERRWGCLCIQDKTSPCPKCAAEKQRRNLEVRFGKPLPKGLPFFPDLNGSTVTKEKMVESFNMVVSKTGKNVKNERGQHVYSGHTLRVTGARFLAGIGMEIMVLMLLARWGSQVVLRYVQDAPLKACTSTTRDLLAKLTMMDTLTKITDKMEENTRAVKSWQEKIDELSQVKEVSEARLLALEDKQEDKLYICNKASGVWHERYGEETDRPPSDWVAKCGYRYGYADFTRAREVPESILWQRVCDKCMKTLRKTRKEVQQDTATGEGEDDDSSESDMSENSTG